MDVHQEGVGGPVALFADSVAWDTIEVHGHGWLACVVQGGPGIKNL